MAFPILRMQVWELWRLVQPELPARILGPLGLAWVLTLLPYDVYDFRIGIAFHVVLVASVLSGLWKNTYSQRDCSGFPLQQHYTKPIGTVRLVIVPMSYLAAMNVAVYLVLAYGCLLVFQMKFPVYAMLLPVACASVVLSSIFWSIRGRTGRVMAFVILISAVAGALVRLGWRMEAIERSGIQGQVLVQFSWQALCVMVAGASMAAAACVVRVGYQRREAAGASNPWQALERVPMFGCERTREFRSPAHAQRWFEFRRASSRAAAVAAVGLAIMAITSSAASIYGPDSIFSVMAELTLYLSPLALVGGTVEATLGLERRAGIARLSLFEATQPQTIPGNIWTKSAAIVTTTSIGWAVIVLGTLATGSVSDGGALPVVWSMISGVTRAGGFEVFALAVLGVSVYGALGATLVLILMTIGYVVSRPLLGASILVPICLSAFAAVAIPILEAKTGADLTLVWRSLFIIWGVILMCVTVLSIRYALRHGFFRMLSVSAIVAGWCAIVVASAGLVWYVGADTSWLTPHVAVFMTGLLCIPVASVAWAPISLSCMRSQ